ncbi:Hypothetical_protein [Hexamita inflata]|uniref:Hypothetical_protein n=1 Tax=Hexamita inflata TaxID=28002 RepID=A0AA86P184_9EUKA|nr:Hypothetical protein HINF_LOCUS16012 [Hexamita inflata]
MIFIASGQQLSGLVLQTYQIIIITETTIQYRLNASQSSGLISCTLQQLSEFSLNNVRIIGCHFQLQAETAYLISILGVPQSVNISSLTVCVDSMVNRVGVSNYSLVQIGTELRQCVAVCQKDTASVYGICISELQFASMQPNSTLLCVDPFLFNGSQCICKEGFVLNGTVCANIVESLRIFEQNIKSNNDKIIKQINVSFDYDQLQQHIINNLFNIQYIIQLQQNETIKFALNIFNQQNFVNENVNNLQVYTSNNISMINNSISRVINISKFVSKLIQKQIDNIQQLEPCINIINNSIIVTQKNVEYINSTINILYQQLKENVFYNNQSLNLQINDIVTNICSKVSSLTHQLNEKQVLINSSLYPIYSSIESFDQLLTNINKSTFDLSNANTLKIENFTNIIFQNISTLQTQLNCSINQSQQLYQNITQNIEQNLLTNLSMLKNTDVESKLMLLNESGFNFQKYLQNSSKTANQAIDNLSQIFLSKQTDLDSDLALITQSHHYLNNNMSELQAQISALKIDREQALMDTVQSAIISSTQQAVERDFDFSLRFPPIFVQTFDIQSISHSISSLSSYIQINNAFINVEDSVLQSQFQLIQQSFFYNLKVQIGAQNVSSGSIFAGVSYAVLNQIILISRVGTIITVSGALNVITQESITVRNMLLNVIIAATGTFSLVDTVKTLNVHKYQVLGSYSGSQQICLGVLNANTCQIYINQFNFAPDLYVAGNMSSFIISSANQSSLQIFEAKIQLGEQSNSNLISSISTTIINYQFGGVACYSIDSTIYVKSITFEQYYQINVDFVGYMGIIVCSAVKSVVSITNICLQAVLNFKTNSVVNCTGIVGILIGNVSISESSVNLSIGQAIYINFGILGYVQGGDSTIVNNIEIQYFQEYKNSFALNENNIAVIIGNTCATTTKISDIFLQNIILRGKQYIGLVIGNQSNGKTNLQNIALLNIQVYGQYCAAFIGRSQATIIINKILLNKSIVVANESNNQYAGAVVSLSSQANIFASNCIISMTNISAQCQSITKDAFSSGFISYCTRSNISVNNYSVFSSNIVQQNYAYKGLSTGLVSFLSQSYLTIMYAQVFMSNLTNSPLNACYSYSAGFIGQAMLQSAVEILQSDVINSTIQSIVKDQSVYNAGYISYIELSTLQLFKCNIDLTNIRTNTQIKSGSQMVTGGIIGSMVTVMLNMMNCSALQICITVNSGQEPYSYTGGIIGQIKTNSVVNVNNTNISKSNLSTINSAIYSYIGAFLGEIQASSLKILRINSYMNNISGTSQNIQLSSGLIASAQSILTIDQVNITFCKILSVSNTDFSSSSGILASISATLNIYNIIINSCVISSNGYNDAQTGGIVGNNSINTVNITFVLVINCTITAASVANIVSVGAIYGLIQSTNTTISNCNIISSIISAVTSQFYSCYGGGILGFIKGYSNITILNSSVINSDIFTKSGQGESYSGGLIGIMNGYENTNKSIYTIISSIVKNSTIRVEGGFTSGTGGLIGHIFFAYATVTDSQVISVQQIAKTFTNCSCINGGIIASIQGSRLILKNSFVSSLTQQFGTGSIIGGVVVGLYQRAQLNISSSYSTGINKINGVQIENCPVFLNQTANENTNITVRGC